VLNNFSRPNFWVLWVLRRAFPRRARAFSTPATTFRKAFLALFASLVASGRRQGALRRMSDVLFMAISLAKIQSPAISHMCVNLSILNPHIYIISGLFISAADHRVRLDGAALAKYRGIEKLLVKDIRARPRQTNAPPLPR